MKVKKRDVSENGGILKPDDLLVAMISGEENTSRTASKSRRQHSDEHYHLPTKGAKVLMESSLQFSCQSRE